MDATPETNGGRCAAFFDLDHTLIDFNSGLRFARSEHRGGRIGHLDMARTALWMLLYRFSLVDMERAFDRAVGHYRGTPAAALDERTRAWFREEIETELLSEARLALHRHHHKGHPLVLLSSTSSYMATMALERWGLDEWLANHFPTDAGGQLTGTFERPLCYGAGKVTRARAWAADNGVSLARSWFYTDSYSDLPMLEAVGHPQVVNPDPRLRRHAKKRGWPIVKWVG